MYNRLKNKVVIYIIYDSLILCLFILSALSYSYTNFYTILFFFFTALIGNLIIGAIFKYNKIVTIFSAFNGFGMLYTGFYIVQQMVLNLAISDERYFMMMLSFFAILVFDFFFCFTNRKISFSRNKNVEISTEYLSMTNFLLCSVLVISLAIEFYFLFVRIGINSYILASRAQKSVLMSEAGSSLYTCYKFTIPIVLIIALQRYLKYDNRFSKVLAFITLVIAVGNSIISMSRAELIAIILPVIFLYEYYDRISKKRIIIMLFAAFLLFGVWKSLFSSGSKFLYYDSEFNTWYEVSENVLNSNPRLLLGKSYFDTIINLFIPFTDAEPLSVWYVKTFEYNTWLRGGGRGFSAVLEAYINFGYLGILFVYAFYGWLLKQAQLGLDSDDDTSNIIYMILLVSMFQFFRSESYSLWKNMMWFRIYPILIIGYFARYVRIGRKR